MKESQIKLLVQSYGRCLYDDGFFMKFYDIFMSSHPEIASKFTGTDFKLQVSFLKKSLDMGLMYLQNSPFAIQHLEKIRFSHSRNGTRNIDPKFYDFWVDSLVKTIGLSDPKYNSEIEILWRQGLNTIANYIKSGY